MLWGLPPETWLELWSGAIGAFVSALAAALVAWGVVSATNKHQANLSKKALQSQLDSATEALELQTALLEKQIAEQRRSERNRQSIDTIVNIIERSNEILARPPSRNLDDIWRLNYHLRTGVTTLRILGGEFAPLAATLHRYPDITSGLAAYVIRGANPDDNTVSNFMWSELNDLVSPVTSLLPHWFEDSEKDRLITLSVIREAIERAEHVRDSVENSKKTSKSAEDITQSS